MITATTLALIVGAFFLISLLYASVGFGGGSSYLAILSLYIKDFAAIKTAGLLCNLVVVSNGSYLFGKKGYFNWKKVLPISACGVPLAFYGATIHLNQKAFFVTLGCVLTISGLLLLLQFIAKPKTVTKSIETPFIINIFLGACIGFLSGLVGIGGGILLSPILNLMRWDEPKKIAALASFFILVNSIAGLAGQIAGNNFKLAIPMTAALLIAVFLGGQLGTRISINAIKPTVLKGLTGILVCYIGLKLVLKYTQGIDI